MNKLNMVEVTTPQLAKLFLQVTVQLYKGDKNWIRPLDKDINDVFDEKKNKSFRFGKCIRWVLKDEKGRPAGRIAAFTNKKYKNKGDEVPVGGIGFFECINNQFAADMLLDTAKNWLQQQGMEAMDGPVNFGERDRWWGLVTQGFTPPLYCMNYNHPYYATLLTNYGFRVFYNQVCFGMDPQKKLADRIHQRHAAAAADPDISFTTIKKNQLEKFAADFATVYNKAWAGHGGLKEMAKEQVLIMFKKMKPVMDERIIYFAYHKGEAIAMFVNLPNLNDYFKHLNGKFGILQKLHFALRQKMAPTKKFNGLVFGVVPEWQGKGIDSYIIGECARIVQAPGKIYTDYEMQWIGDFNPKMINVAENLGDTYHSRVLSTYRFLFDRQREFKRHPMLG
jgi:GNAT superfamily N-acetyltransferase